MIGIDKDAGKIAMLDDGQAADLRAGPARTGAAQPRENGRLNFTTELASALSKARLIFIAVGTPQSGQRRRPILPSIWAVTDAMAGI